ncbi:zonular occludens toxin domain-containing protein [Acinetobacter nosocomialis]|uniref:zonular occludens toxin domain-containing protein n=2 Tax=Acinetobacter nosocomialis TaxID=106654 RepID=UPI00280E2ECB|nr:zonular occludens toxin domain-containing protein [Acinetobacter nosocomialis]MDQ8804160.1 zonular occludens toxin domain-containing protein [Acinetobacter nosocomialis]MDQ8850364.1 zonular occludens toxin domain-containing protein [Acinetobacter nosocomialis]MDQ8854411.1 zonular occludens toxin domain-containing protein [Acinetobacter nosocomialis]MDQ8894494.1 zonular occludens toxin domain-containing protein [Acinetobacter nosocomialis]
MSILISAPIRTGKTLFAIECIFKELNKGRVVYTNIIDIKIPGVISVSSSVHQPFDWRDLPNGCVLVWDEAHEHPAFSEQDLLKDFTIDESSYDERMLAVDARTDITPALKKKVMENIDRERKQAIIRKKEEIKDIGRGLLLHGHFGIEIYFITQRVTKLNTDVLASVTNHYVLRRKFGFDAATIWEFGEAMTTWSKSTAESALNKKYWRYPKHLYKFYKSSEHHAVKKTFPLKYAAFALIPILLLGNGFRQAYERNFFGLFGKKEQPAQVQPVQQPISQSLPPNTAPPKTLADQAALDAKLAGLTPEQYADLMHPERRNQQLQQQQQQGAQDNQQRIQAYNVSYDINNPYDVQTNQQYTATSQPVFSGCIKYKGKYYAYTNQGTRIKTINPDVCKRVIDDGDRPYNYFQKPQQQQYVQQQPIQQQQPQSVQKFDAEFVAKYQAAKQQGLI